MHADSPRDADSAEPQRDGKKVMLRVRPKVEGEDLMARLAGERLEPKRSLRNRYTAKEIRPGLANMYSSLYALSVQVTQQAQMQAQRNVEAITLAR